MQLYDINGNVLINSDYFANVIEYGAKGDGTTDDAASIQSALDALQTTGGIIYFPKGTYKITEHVLFYSNQTLWFEPGAVLLQGAGINNLLMTYCASDVEVYGGVHDCLIYGATFDGGAYTTSNTLVGTVHAKNITFEKCTFKNAYGTWHDMEINSSYNVKALNCDFEGARKTGENACLIQLDAMTGTFTWPWDDNIGVTDDTPSKYIEIAGCIFHDDTISPAIGNHSSASPCVSHLNIHDNVFDGLTSERGAINFWNADNVNIHGNDFNGCTLGVLRGTAQYYIHDNIFRDVTTVTGGSPVFHDNMVNGTYTE